MTYIDSDTRDLQEALQQRLSERFRRIRIVSVSVDSDSLYDDDVIEITVQFEGSRDDLVQGQPAGLFGIVRDTIAEFCRDGAPSPVLNFRSIDAAA